MLARSEQLVGLASGRWQFLRARRFWLAGPLAFLTAVLVMAAGAVWMPPGAAGVDNIILPLVLFPVFWSVLFFYGCLTACVVRGLWVVSGLAVVQIGIIVLHLV